MREHVTSANLVTSASLGLGFAALLVSQHRLGIAAGLLLVAAALDGVDGALARRRGRANAFGAELDSLTDVVCFSLVPSAALWWALLDRLPLLGGVACTTFLIAGAWRLARFRLVQRPDRFVGLPTPAAGLLLMAVALWCPLPWVAVVAALALSASMVSSLPVPTVPAVLAAVPARGRATRTRRLVRTPHPLQALQRRRRRGHRRRGAVLRRRERRTPGRVARARSALRPRSATAGQASVPPPPRAVGKLRRRSR